MASLDSLPKMALCPLRDGYRVKLGDDVISTQFDRGPPRQRLGGVGSPHELPVAFRHKAIHQDYIYNFWQLRKTRPFAMRLIIGDSQLRWYQCSFIGSPETSSLGGNVHEFTINLSVKPMPFDAVIAQDFIDLYELTGGDISGFANALEKLVNVDLPSAMRGL